MLPTNGWTPKVNMPTVLLPAAVPPLLHTVADVAPANVLHAYVYLLRPAVTPEPDEPTAKIPTEELPVADCLSELQPELKAETTSPAYVYMLRVLVLIPQFLEPMENKATVLFPAAEPRAEICEDAVAAELTSLEYVYLSRAVAHSPIAKIPTVLLPVADPPAEDWLDAVADEATQEA
jgi:hypothetical protein